MIDLEIYKDEDIDKSFILNKKIAVIGYGSQGQAQALNLRDSGCNVVLGLRKDGESCKQALLEKFNIMEIEDAVIWADIVQILIPDEAQEQVYREKIAPNLRDGQYLMFSHGFCINYGYIVPPENVNVIMVAAKNSGAMVRENYLKSTGTPALFALHQDVSGDSRKIALAYAWAIGSGKAGIFETTFKEETEANLFGEQAIICGGCTSLIKTAFETLTEAGISPAVAYIETLHDLKIVVDALYKSGLTGLYSKISNTAGFGALTKGPKVIDNEVKNSMKKVLEEIQDGTFAQELIEDYKSDYMKYNQLKKENENILIEQVGKRLRDSFFDTTNKVTNNTRN